MFVDNSSKKMYLVDPAEIETWSQKIKVELLREKPEIEPHEVDTIAERIFLVMNNNWGKLYRHNIRELKAEVFERLGLMYELEQCKDRECTECSVLEKAKTAILIAIKAFATEARNCEWDYDSAAPGFSIPKASKDCGCGCN